MGKLNKLKCKLYKFSNKAMVPLIRNQNIFGYYHLINDSKLNHIQGLYSYKNIDQFEKDIDFLLRNYKPINPKDLLEKKNKNGFLLTFDDGLVEIYDVIYPILKKKGISAIFFLNPDFIENSDRIMYRHLQSLITHEINGSQIDSNILTKIGGILNVKENDKNELEAIIKVKIMSDKNNLETIANILGFSSKDYLKTKPLYISKSQIHEMIKDGFYFGGHTMSHSRLEFLSYDKQMKEIINSIKWVKEKFNLNYTFFAFPFSDAFASKKLLNEVLSTDAKLIIFGNSGIKQDISSRIIQRISLEDPTKQIEKVIVSENLLKICLKMLRKYKLARSE